MTTMPVREHSAGGRLALLAVLLALSATRALAEETTSTPMAGPDGPDAEPGYADVSMQPEERHRLLRITAGWPVGGYWSARPALGLPEAEPPPLISLSPVARGKFPLPPRRPLDLGRVPAFKAVPELITPEISAVSGDCHAQLQAYGTTFAPAGQPGNGACGIDNPVRVAAVARAAGGSISLPDRPVVACRLAVRFAEWVRATAPVLDASHGAPLIAITTGPGWDCRTRNRQPGAKLSSHGRGLALDVNHWSFANRARLTVTGSGGKPIFQTVRRAACTWFTTVLGPGSDGFHQDHLHVDIEGHGRGRARLCR